MNIKDRILIFSVFEQGRPDYVNEDNHQTIVNKLTQLGIGFKVLDGVYYGSKELSILVFDTESNRAMVEALCRKFNQDCYLESDNDRTTNLVYPEHREYIGVLQNVDSVSGIDCYSYDSQNNTYWITR